MEGGSAAATTNVVTDSKHSRGQSHYAETSPLGISDAIISVKEARKLLGKDLRKLSDEQVEIIVHRLESIARHYIISRV